MRLEPRDRAPLALRILAPVGAGALALALCAIPLLWAEASVGEAYALMFQGALGSRFAITETLTRSAPLMLTGLAAAVAFRAKLWNIGAEGQFYVGALMAIVAGSGAISAPPILLVPIVMLAGAAGGALLMAGPTILKLRLGVDEVVTTLLLNFIVLLFVSMMLEGPMQDPMGMGWPQTEPVVANAELPKLIARTRLHGGLIIALVAGVVVWIVTNHGAWGFGVRAVGHNPRAARFAGMPVQRLMLSVGLVSGALAGLAGAAEVAGLKGYLTLDLSPGYGYSGIVVAMLAQLNPLGVIVAALFVSAVFVGADFMSRTIGVSSYLADVIVATSLLTMLLAGLIVRYRVHLGRG